MNWNAVQNLNCLPVFEYLLYFWLAEVPGRDRPGAVLQATVLSWRTPQPHIRTFCSVPEGRMQRIYFILPSSHLAPLYWEEGLRPFKDETFDHPSDQRWGEETSWKEDGRYTATVQWSSPAHGIIHFSVEPTVVQTLLVVLAIDGTEQYFCSMHTECRTFFLALNVYVCFSTSSCIKLCLYEVICTGCI